MRSLLWVVLIAFVGVVGYALVVQRNNVAPPAATAPADDPAARPALVGSIEEIMEGVVEPAADVVFESVSTTISKVGVVQKRPQNDEEWARVEHNALALAETANLITMTGRAVAPAVQSPTVTADPNAPELTPEEIRVKIDADPALFAKYANSLQKAALLARDHAKNKNVQGLVEVGEAIDLACENCHLYYWYPKKGVAPPLP